ncbi:MAG: YgiT-type zinc finger protein [Candidatus Latescibacteria bacterium]|nr:YgiT-type zinc finger protein [Candidatus Latescibacterota bacterium]
MNCIHCRGQMKRSAAPFHIDRNGYHLVFDTVPAWACDQCGEAYFEEREVSVIQSATKGLDQQAQRLVADT